MNGLKTLFPNPRLLGKMLIVVSKSKFLECTFSTCIIDQSNTSFQSSKSRVQNPNLPSLYVLYMRILIGRNGPLVQMSVPFKHNYSFLTIAITKIIISHNLKLRNVPQMLGSRPFLRRSTFLSCAFSWLHKKLWNHGRCLTWWERCKAWKGSRFSWCSV